jgi:hypothetical protein
VLLGLCDCLLSGAMFQDVCGGDPFTVCLLTGLCILKVRVGVTKYHCDVCVIEGGVCSAEG